MQVNFLEKLPKLVALQNFQSSYLSCGESLNHNTLSHYYLRHIKHIFENITYITKNTPKLVAKILATKFGFVPDCWKFFNIDVIFWNKNIRFHINSIFVQIVSASPTLLLNAILATWAQFCKDCYIISTCTLSCPATGTAWLWWLAWAGAWLCYPLMWLSIHNKEWDITVIQPTSSTSTSELFKKALVDIWIALYLIKFQFLEILCVFVFLSLEEFFITGVQSCPY